MEHVVVRHGALARRGVLHDAGFADVRPRSVAGYASAQLDARFVQLGRVADGLERFHRGARGSDAES